MASEKLSNILVGQRVGQIKSERERGREGERARKLRCWC